MAPSRIFWIRACRAGEWRHIRPAAILRFFFSAASPARMIRCDPDRIGGEALLHEDVHALLDGILEVRGRKAEWVVSRATSPGRRQSIALR